MNFVEQLTETFPMVRRYAWRLTKDVDLIDDLMQDVAVRAWRHQEQLQAGTNMLSWLCTILRNEYFTHSRRLRNRPTVVSYSAVSNAEEFLEGHSVNARQEAIYEAEQILTQVHALPSPFREALELIALDDLSYEEASDRLHCEVGTVKSRVFRGRALLSKLREAA
jgi:RNA polymerase sigma-70 factor (ECF subfamily)